MSYDTVRPYSKEQQLKRAPRQPKDGSKKDRTAVYRAATDAARDNQGRLICAKCQLPIKGKEERDHIIPRGRGGKTTTKNVQVLCQPCHYEKHSGGT